jgi:serine/threonine protein kinase
VSHPNIVAVHDVVADRGLPCLVMRLVEGRSLGDTVRSSGPLEPQRVAQIGVALVDALAAAHRGGVVHRDVKPSNVLLTEDGEVLLTDFSIATDSLRGTASAGGGALGSPGYIAPERLNGHSTGREADLFGLGATLFCAVEGFGPFDRHDPLAALLATATNPHPAPQRAGALAPVLDALLVKDPADRPDLVQVRAALSAVARGENGPTEELRTSDVEAGAPGGDAPTVVTAAASESVAAASAGAGGNGPPRLGRPMHKAPFSRRRRTALLGAIAVAVCAAIVVAIVMLNGGDGADGGPIAAPASLSAPSTGASAASASASPTASASTSASTSASPTPSASASDSKSASATPSESPDPVGQVTSAELSVSPKSYLGSCANPVTFTISLSVAVSDGPTDVRYTISLAPGDSEVAGGAGTAPDSDTPAEFSDQVALDFTQGNRTYAVQAVVESPTRFSPVPAQISVLCVG